MIKVVDIRFKRVCKFYEFECSGFLDLMPGDSVIVEVEKGLGMGIVVSVPRDGAEEKRPRPLKKVIRKATPADLERLAFNSKREEESLKVCAEKIKSYGLPMKLVRAEYLFDSSKAIFYFTSDTRVDFRRLVKDLASSFHTRIEMRQIGVRDEAKMLGGIGPCGRELCCSSFLPEFTPVTIKMAKQQNLALNPSKISGVCGRLMCCLSYEHRGYSGGDKGRRAGGSCCDRKKGNDRGAESERRPDKERPGAEKRPGGDREARNEKRPNEGRSGGERRPVRGRRPLGEKKTDGEKKPNEGFSGGERKAGGERRPRGERRSRGGRRGGRSRRPSGDRRPGENRGAD